MSEASIPQLRFPISYLPACHVDRSPQFGYQLHTHGGYFEIDYVRSGRVEETINGGAYSFGPGTLIFIRPQDVHQLHGAGLVFYNILYPQELLSVSAKVRALAEQRDVPYVIIPEAVRPEWEHRLDEILVRQHTPEGELLLTHLFYEAMVRWFCPASVSERPAMPDWLSGGLLEMEQMEVSRWTVGLIVKKCHKTREHVARTFQAVLGRSPSQYINWRRLETVRKLLIVSNQSIGELCFHVGFNNMNYFNRLFRRYFATTPGHYRREHGVRHRQIARTVTDHVGSDTGT